MMQAPDEPEAKTVAVALTVEPCCLDYQADDQRVITVTLTSAPECEVEGRFGGETTWRSSRRLTAEEAAPIVALRTVRLPVEAAPAFGCDGVWYSLSVQSGGDTALSLRWWCELPPEWAPVRDGVRMLEAVGEEIAHAASGGRGLGGLP